ncbi:MAG: alanine racemase [Micrococcus sp.]|nr:alanine racemase [Micrococcus sp.]
MTDGYRSSEERCAVVDLSAVAANVAALTQRVTREDGSRPLLTAVVKADAYGHGAVPVARAALAAGADRLGVAHVSEALALREAGVAGEIMAWLHTPATDFTAALDAQIILGVSGWDLDAVIDAAAQRGMSEPARIHLKIDTGLGRNGCSEAEWTGLVERARAAEAAGHITVEGVFSHFAVADERDRAEETTEQLRRFEAAVDAAVETMGHPVIRHVANTPATLSRPDTHLDMVRVGLGLYGLSPFEGVPAAELGLSPVMSLRTQLAAVKSVPAGQGVSYGYRYRTEQATRLGLVPVGYGEGVPRLADGAPVWVAGQQHRVAGRIAMDQFVVDLGPDVVAEVGDEVELFGSRSGIPADAWADAAGTINYELVTRIGSRLPRVYRESPGTPSFQRTWTTQTPEETQTLAERLAELTRAGDVLVLTGDLGAGKTTFTQGLGHGLGMREGIISPTFVLARVHPSATGGPDLVHVDAYRLNSAAELTDMDLDTSVASSVTVVEWGRGIAEMLAGYPDVPEASWLDIELRRATGADASGEAGEIITDFSEEEDAAEQRTLTITAYGPRWADGGLSDLNL